MRYTLLLLLVACGSSGDQAYSIIGPPGPTGATGATGPQGPAGTPAVSCSVNSISANSTAPNGGALIACPDGTQALILNGTNGANGTNGTNGTNGANGTNGTIITPIQFCPGGPGEYPSTFPEVGFCINNSLYAVYSANGGFLTEVLPGTWSSDGINSSCTFTILPNCVVQ